jgi:hypothetical protein
MIEMDLELVLLVNIVLNKYKLELDKIEVISHLEEDLI